MHQQWEEERLLREYLFIKQQLDQQWEGKMMIKKEGTSLEIYAHELACLPIPHKPMGDQSHTYSLVVCLCNIPLFFFEHCIFNLNFFYALCKWVFDASKILDNKRLASSKIQNSF